MRTLVRFQPVSNIGEKTDVLVQKQPDRAFDSDDGAAKVSTTFLTHKNLVLKKNKQLKKQIFLQFFFS